MLIRLEIYLTFIQIIRKLESLKNNEHTAAVLVLCVYN